MAEISDHNAILIQMMFESTSERRMLRVWKRWMCKDVSWEEYESEVAGVRGMNVFCETNVDRMVEGVTEWIQEVNGGHMKSRASESMEVERFHRQLKTAIKCHANDRWTEILPTVLLGIRAAHREDLYAFSAELVYGQTLRLSAEFFAESKANDGNNMEPADIKQLWEVFNKVRPTEGSRHGTRKTFQFKNLSTASHVFIRVDQVKTPLQNPYEGPSPVVCRNNKTYIVRVRGKDTHVSVGRLKSSYILDENDNNGYAQGDVRSRIMREPAIREPIDTQTQRKCVRDQAVESSSQTAFSYAGEHSINFFL